MARSLFSSVFEQLEPTSIDEIASRLGESRQAVSRGFEMSAASLIDGVAHRSNDAMLVREIYSLISQAPTEVNISDLASAATNPGAASTAIWPVLDSGNRLVSQVFGRYQSFVTDSIARTSGLKSSSTSALMSFAAPLLMTSLGRLIRRESLKGPQLSKVISHEGPGIRNLVPAGVEEMFERTSTSGTASYPGALPVSAGDVLEPRRLTSWRWVTPILLIIPLSYWLTHRVRTTDVSQISEPGKAGLGDYVARKLPDNAALNIPRYGVEAQLLDFLQDPSKKIDPNAKFDFDRVLFDTDSANLRPESQEQLRNVAAILRAYPNALMNITGYTDNTGDSQQNLKLSQDRAESVVRELTRLGIAGNRLAAQGFGAQYPAADNSTQSGRARNRRVTMSLTQR